MPPLALTWAAPCDGLQHQFDGTGRCAARAEAGGRFHELHAAVHAQAAGIHDLARLKVRRLQDRFYEGLFMACQLDDAAEFLDHDHVRGLPGSGRS